MRDHCHRLLQTLAFPFKAAGAGGAVGTSSLLPRRHSPPGCPVFNQMFLILQEVEQGANLSLIFEARPLI